MGFAILNDPLKKIHTLPILQLFILDALFAEVQ